MTAAEAADAQLQEHSDGTVSVGIQTAYRDSEAQTGAYSPDVIIPEGTDPEVARLAFLKFGGPSGTTLPVGKAEILEVERLRRRAAIQRNLPPMTDEASFELRKGLMEELEMETLAHREEELDDEHSVRLQLVEQALTARADSRAFVAEQRLAELKRKLEADTAAALADITARRIKSVRKLGRTRAAVERHVDVLTGTGTFTGVVAGNGKVGAKGAKPTRDIIAEYADYGSKVYAPLLRDGRHTDKLSTAARYEHAAATHGLHTYAGLANLEASLPARVTEVALLRRTGGGVGATAALSGSGQLKRSTLQSKADAAVGDDLDRIYAMIQTVKAGKSTAAIENEAVPAWRHPEPTVERPHTPTFDGADETADSGAVEAAVMLLQAVIRGRRDQALMFQGTARRLELIAEMRADLQSAEESGAAAAAEEARRTDRVRKAARHAVADAAAGEVSAATLDFLAKELVRSKEMARITALAAAAEAERARREEAETQRRAAERRERVLAEAVARAEAETSGAAASALVDAVVSAAVLDHSYRVAGKDTGLRHTVLRPIVERLERSGRALARRLGQGEGEGKDGDDDEEKKADEDAEAEEAAARAVAEAAASRLLERSILPQVALALDSSGAAAVAAAMTIADGPSPAVPAEEAAALAAASAAIGEGAVLSTSALLDTSSTLLLPAEGEGEGKEAEAEVELEVSGGDTTADASALAAALSGAEGGAGESSEGAEGAPNDSLNGSGGFVLNDDSLVSPDPSLMLLSPQTTALEAGNSLLMSPGFGGDGDVAGEAQAEGAGTGAGAEAEAEEGKAEEAAEAAVDADAIAASSEAAAPEAGESKEAEEEAPAAAAEAEAVPAAAEPEPEAALAAEAPAVAETAAEAPAEAAEAPAE